MNEVLQTSTKNSNADEKPFQIIIKKYSNGLEVIDTGVIHSYNASEIKLVINNLSIVIQFLKNEEKHSSYRISADPEDKRTLFLKLNNFESSFSEGSPESIHVANISNRKIYLSFFVTTIDKNIGARSFAYTILAGE